MMTNIQLPNLLCCLALLAGTALPAPGSAQKLPIAFCTPENSQCPLATDGKPETCFNASHLQENFYFAVFNTIGDPVSVDRLTLSVGSGQRTRYAVSLASGSVAHDLNCTTAGQTIECPAGLDNVTSLMVRSEPLMSRLNLLEVAAFNANGSQIEFTYCVAPESASCEPAMDKRWSADSPAVVSQPAQFPSWYGGMSDEADPVSTVKIYRPAAKSDAAAATFYRVHAFADCEKVGQSSEPDGVEVLEFRCSNDPVNLLQVWEIDADYLVSLCEVEVLGK